MWTLSEFERGGNLIGRKKTFKTEFPDEPWTDQDGAKSTSSSRREPGWQANSKTFRRKHTHTILTILIVCRNVWSYWWTTCSEYGREALRRSESCGQAARRDGSEQEGKNERKKERKKRPAGRECGDLPSAAGEAVGWGGGNLALPTPSGRATPRRSAWTCRRARTRALAGEREPERERRRRAQSAGVSVAMPW